MFEELDLKVSDKKKSPDSVNPKTIISCLKVCCTPQNPYTCPKN